MRRAIIVEDDHNERLHLKGKLADLEFEVRLFSAFSELGNEISKGQIEIESGDVLIFDCNIESEGSLAECLQMFPFFEDSFDLLSKAKILLRTGNTAVDRERLALERMGYRNVGYIYKGKDDIESHVMFKIK
jgi:hypothetical protein